MMIRAGAMSCEWQDWGNWAGRGGVGANGKARVGEGVMARNWGEKEMQTQVQREWGGIHGAIQGEDVVVGGSLEGELVVCDRGGGERGAGAGGGDGGSAGKMNGENGGGEWRRRGRS